MPSLTRITPLDGEAILPLVDAKAQLRVMHTHEDALIGALRNAAIGHVERTSAIALAPTTYRWAERSFPTRFDLPMRPVTAIVSVAYHDADYAEQVYADARLAEASVWPAAGGTWPDAYGYASVTFTAGLASPDEAPELIAAVKLMLTHLFENRSAVEVSNNQAIEVPLGVQALIGTYRPVFV